MLKLGFEPEKLIGFNKNALFPALIIGAFLVYFFSVSEFSEERYHALHGIFLCAVGFTLLAMGYFRQLSAVMAVSVIYVSYLVINSQRYIYGEDYMFSAGYNIWTILLLPNLLLAYFLFYQKGPHKYWSWFYIFLFSETALVEKLQNQSLNADSYYFYKHIGMLNYPALYVSAVCLIILFVYHICKGRILSAAVFFSAVSVFMGIYLSDDLFAFSLFFTAAVLTVLLASAYYIYYTNYRDEELNTANYKSYYSDAEKKYPLKYSIALMYIDEYERLLRRFGAHKTVLLKKMFLNCIKKANAEVLVYNYKDDAFILAFMNANAAESFEQAEDIRRSIAKSIFVFNENNHLQLTVSQCISEKKRSDADAAAVLARAEENLQKVCKFTRNITVKV